jgi:hypothetical protein
MGMSDIEQVHLLNKNFIMNFDCFIFCCKRDLMSAFISLFCVIVRNKIVFEPFWIIIYLDVIIH